MKSLTFNFQPLLPLTQLQTPTIQRPLTTLAARTRPEIDPTSSGISGSSVKTLAHFTSLHNHIRVLEVSRRADHPFAGSRLLLLDSPGNIHSISFLFTPFTSTYFDVFATFPPILPALAGPIALFGFGAGSAARLILHLYPNCEIHGWELDPSVISVAREFFSLRKLEKQYRRNLFIHIGDAFDADIRNCGGEGFAGILVDLFSNGRLLPELQEEETWRKLKGKLRRGGRVMVNCGGSCVEGEDGNDGRLVREETLKVMARVFADEVFVLSLGWNKEDSCVAFTGKRPDFVEWKGKVVEELRGYVDMWEPYKG